MTRWLFHSPAAATDQAGNARAIIDKDVRIPAGFNHDRSRGLTVVAKGEDFERFADSNRR